MSPEEKAEKIAQRADRLELWWPLLNEPYDNLISRSEYPTAQGGQDKHPHSKPCEHRLAWRVGKLCLGCDNTGWRRLTKAERANEQGIDPYLTNISSGITIIRDESPTSRRVRESKTRDAQLAALQRDARIRAGVEAEEDRMMRNYRMVENKRRTVVRITKGVEILRLVRPSLYEQLPNRASLIALAKVMYRVLPGHIPLPGDVGIA